MFTPVLFIAHTSSIYSSHQFYL